MISSPSAQIVNALAEKISITDIRGRDAPAYGPVMGIATAIIAMGIVATVAVGPERRGRHFELAHVAGEDVVNTVKGLDAVDVEAGDGEDDKGTRTLEIEKK